MHQSLDKREASPSFFELALASFDMFRYYLLITGRLAAAID